MAITSQVTHRIVKWRRGAARAFCIGLVLLRMTASSAADQEEAARFQSAYERVDEFIAQQMRESRTPGMAVAFTSREGLLHVATYGFADIKMRTPVAPETLFEIGSISKSFTAIALLQLQQEGKLDVQQPVTKYLPWFQIQSKFAPITIHHLLTHTAGIPRDRDDITSSAYQAFALRERATGYACGTKFAYSNIGYQVLGYLLEEIEKQPYAEIIRKRISEPLGMKSSVAAITHETRQRLAVGYVSWYDDRPAHSSHPLVEATWFEYGAGDGSIAATPADLVAYLRMLLNRGAGPHGRILSEASFRLLTQRAVKRDGNTDYGYGIATQQVDGHMVISHGGGMVGYASILMGDLDDGLGVVVLVNGPGNSGRVAEFALKALRAALHRQELPEVTPSTPRTQVKNAADYAGTYTSADGRKLVFVAEGERLFLLHGAEKIALERRGANHFYAHHPDFAMFQLEFGREKEQEKDKPAKVLEVFHGSQWFANENYSGSHTFAVPDEWRAYPGHYRSYSPWLSNFRIVLRKDKLWLLLPGGGGKVLAPLEPRDFQIGEEETAERLRIDAVAGGRALRANLSGVDFFRVFTR